MSASGRRWEWVPEAVRTSMRGDKSKDTTPEMLVRQLLRSAGYSYRLHRKDLPGKPDLGIAPVWVLLANASTTRLTDPAVRSFG